jgi:hypothetical protein
VISTQEDGVSVQLPLEKKKMKADGKLDKYGRPNEATPAKWNTEYKDFNAPLEGSAPAPVAEIASSVPTLPAIEAPEVMLMFQWPATASKTRRESVTRERQQRRRQSGSERRKRKRKRKQRRKARRLRRAMIANKSGIGLASFQDITCLHRLCQAFCLLYHTFCRIVAE